MKDNIFYNKETGKECKFVKFYNDKEMIVEDKKHNKVIIDKNNAINLEIIDTFKTILKMLCKNGELILDHDKYSNAEGTFFETSIHLDNQRILYDKTKF